MPSPETAASAPWRCTCGAGPGIETTGLHEPFCGLDASEPRASAPPALTEWFLHEWFEDWDTPAAEASANEVIRLLRSLPVEQRMAAMGMTPADAFGLGITWQEATDADSVQEALARHDAEHHHLVADDPEVLECPWCA